MVCGPATSFHETSSPCISITVNSNHKVKALVDSGSPVSFISSSCGFLQTLGKQRKCSRSFLSVCGNPFIVKRYVECPVSVKDRIVVAKLLITDTPHRVILGCDTLSLLNATVTFNPPGIHFDNPPRPIVTSSVSQTTNMSENLTRRQCGQLSGLLGEFADRFSSSPEDIGRTTTVKHSIVTEGNPVKLKAYRQPETHKGPTKEMIDKMLKNGVIRHSSSPWSFPFFLIKKKNGTYRFVVDYRRLNQQTVKDCFPLPLIDELLVNLSGSRYFTTLDLSSGYWQVEIEEESKHKTAFQADGQLFEFNVMPFGLCNAPATFQRLMQNILGDLNLLPYIDDVIIASNDFSDHLKSIRCILMRLRDHNLKLNASKCQFGYPSIVYLGHHVSSEGVRADPAKVEKLKSIGRPTSKRETEALLGFANYLSKFVRNYAGVMASIFAAKQTTPFNWTPEADAALQKLKQLLAEDALLRFPDFDKQFTLSVDASNVALGAYLSQEGCPIAYASRLLHGAELNYSTTDREFLALTWAVKNFRPYLLGRKFLILTDHQPLISMVRNKAMNSRHARYQLTLEEYNFDLRHIPGSENYVADALSRLTSPLNPEAEPYFPPGHANHTPTSVVSPVTAADSDNVNENDIIARYHNAGHFSINKVRRAVLDAGHNIKSLRAKLYHFASTCPQCISNKSYTATAQNAQLPTAPAVEPMEFVAMDIVGPLPQQGPYRFILTMVDHATRWLEAVPLAKIDAATVCRTFCKQWIFRFGAPRIVHSDRGTQFESAVFGELMKKFNIKKSKTTAYWPAGNGINERVHRTLGDRLRCSTQPWPDALQEAVFNINRTEHSTIKQSPFLAVFHRHATLPADWPTKPSAFRSHGCDRHLRTPKKAAVRIHLPASKLAPRFGRPVSVRRRLSRQLLLLGDGRTVNVRNCKLVY